MQLTYQEVQHEHTLFENYFTNSELYLLKDEFGYKDRETALAWAGWIDRAQYSGWICTSERLPLPNIPVWAGRFNANNQFEYGLFSYCSENNEWWRCGSSHSTDTFGEWTLDNDTSPTHWQSLPAPPKNPN